MTETYIADKAHPGARAVLGALSKAINSAPLTNHLKNNVYGWRLETDLSGTTMTFIVTNEMAQQNLLRNIGRIRDEMRERFRECDNDLVSVKVEIEK